MNKETLIVNIIGGPGCGKTILSAELFAKVKRAYITCDLVMEEYKKRLAEQAIKVTDNQIKIFGDQQFQMFANKGEVDVIITDSPILLPTIYDKKNCPHLKNLALTEF